MTELRSRSERYYLTLSEADQDAVNAAPADSRDITATHYLPTPSGRADESRTPRGDRQRRTEKTMTVLRSQSQSYALALSEADEDVIDEAAARALPPIRNVLVLQDNLPPAVLAKLRKELAFLEGYVWFLEENVNRAAKCCVAAVALSQGNGPPTIGINFPNNRRPASSGNPKDYKFFIEQILNVHRRDIDMYDLDRAVKAVEVNGTGIAPQKYDDIPKVIQKNGKRYELVKKEFSWPSPVPDRVVDAVADFAIETPPDEFWIADYALYSASYDPIVYARFGDWHVEVVRWE